MYKALAIGLFVPSFVFGYTHQEYFSQFGKMLDEMDTQMAYHRSRFFDHQDATSYSVKQTDGAVVVKFNTGKKISPETIDVQTSSEAAFVTFKDEGKETRITLQQDKGYVVISMCSQESSSIFSGTACASQIIPAVINLDTLQAEYAATELTITVALSEPVQTKTKKIPVAHKEHVQKPLIHDK